MNALWENNFEYRKELNGEIIDRLSNFYIDLPDMEHPGVNTSKSIFYILSNCGCIQTKDAKTYYDNRYGDIIMSINAILTQEISEDLKYSRILYLIGLVDQTESPFPKYKDQAYTRRILNTETAYQSIIYRAKKLNIEKQEAFNELSPLFVATVLFINNIEPSFIGTEDGFFSLANKNGFQIAIELQNKIKLALVKISEQYENAYTKLNTELNLAIKFREDNSNKVFRLLKLQVLARILRIALENQGHDYLSNKAILQEIQSELSFAKDIETPHASVMMEKFFKEVEAEVNSLSQNQTSEEEMRPDQSSQTLNQNNDSENIQPIRAA